MGNCTKVCRYDAIHVVEGTAEVDPEKCVGCKDCTYACINHGVKAGMNKAMLEMKNAVRCGYWNLLRYNPALAEAGKNPLSIDSAKPTENYNDFIMRVCR